MIDTQAPTVTNVTRRAGIAGQFSVSADVSYVGEPAQRIEFVGSVYGGPVVMVLSSGAQTFVTEPDRFGEFGVEWVRRFFGRNSDTGSAALGALIFLPFLAGLAWLLGALIGMAQGATS